MTEVWKKIPGFNFYEVSNKGLVRSIDRIISQLQPRFSNIIIQRNFKSKILKQCNLNQKYKMVTLCNNTIKYKFLVHRLVLLAFIGICPEGMECCHNDGNGFNNYLENLRWDTPRNNQLDRKAHGTDFTPHFQGENHPMSKLKEADVLWLRENKPDKENIIILANKFGLTRGAIKNALIGKSWKHL